VLTIAMISHALSSALCHILLTRRQIGLELSCVDKADPAYRFDPINSVVFTA
jgi:hypothetical protein